MNYDRRFPFPLLTAVFAALILLSGCSPRERSGFFVATIGNDTLAVETYTRSREHLKGTSITRNPRTTVRTYEATFVETGGLATFRYSSVTDGGPAMSGEYVYAEDSVIVTMKRDTATRSYVANVAGRPYPFFENLFGGWNEAFLDASKEFKPAFYILAGRRTLEYNLRKNDDGTVDLLNPNNDFGPMHVVPSRDEGFTTFDMTATTDKYIVQRVDRLDMGALEASFKARDNAGAGLGTLSPRDTIHATVGRARITIDYGRPSLRGRTIFGNVVPHGEVWRTGANQATQFTTDRTVVFGDKVLPPATYTLFTVPDSASWTFVVNGQHGQWGTVYDQTKDVARSPMNVTTLSGPVDLMEIGVSSKGSTGTITVTWDRTTASVDFTVR